MDQSKTRAANNYDYDEIDLRDIFKTLGKWKKTIVAVTLVFMLVSGIISWFFIEPVYEANTIVAVSQPFQLEKQSVGNIEDMVNQISDVPVITPESSVEQVTAPGILQASIDRLKLPYKRNQLAQMIKVEQIKTTNLIKITVSHTDPQKAALIANTVREEFLVHINQVNEQKLGNSLNMMQTRWIKEEEGNLKEVNDQLKNHKLQTRSIDFLTVQLARKNEDLASLQSKLLLAQIEKDKLQNGIEQDRQNLKNTPMTISTTAKATGLLPADLNGINIKDGQVINESINEAYTKALEALNEKTSSLASTEAEIVKTRQEIKSLEQDIKVMEAEQINNQIEEKKLQNEVDQRENVIKVLNNKIAEIKMTEAMDLAGNSILTVSAAAVPEAPVKPNKMLNVAIAAVLGLMLSVFGVFLVEYLKSDDNE